MGKPLRFTQEQASMVATALVDAIGRRDVSLCCAPDALEACAAIVGKRRAQELRDWFYESLGCTGIANDEEWLEIYLAKIANRIEAA